jgi:hypothetical protein
MLTAFYQTNNPVCRRRNPHDVRVEPEMFAVSKEICQPLRLRKNQAQQVLHLSMLRRFRWRGDLAASRLIKQRHHSQVESIANALFASTTVHATGQSPECGI